AALMATNQFAAARARLDTATRHFPPDLPDDLARLARGRLAGLRAHIAFVVGDFDQAAPLFDWWHGCWPMQRQKRACIASSRSACSRRWPTTPSRITSGRSTCSAAFSTYSSMELPGPLSRLHSSYGAANCLAYDQFLT